MFHLAHHSYQVAGLVKGAWQLAIFRSHSPYEWFLFGFLWLQATYDHVRQEKSRPIGPLALGVCTDILATGLHCSRFLQTGGLQQLSLLTLVLQSAATLPLYLGKTPQV